MKNKVFIIAEAGVNHNGQEKLALEMCAAAKQAEVDAIKFQTFDTETNVLKDCAMAEYQKKNVGEAESHWQMIKKLELSYQSFQKIKAYCDKLGLEFMSAPSEIKSLTFLLTLGMAKIKISSGEITNLPLLRAIGQLKKEVILSTGMADLAEIEAALTILTQAGTPKNKITILHCHTDYPTAMEQVNLAAMITIREALKVRVGYSDHTLGLEAPIAAVALGATMIEKHFTLDRQLAGPDHAASLVPDELRAMVLAIRNTAKAIGNGRKVPSKTELKYKHICRKTIVAKRAIKQGEVYAPANITVKRPEIGLSAMKWDEVIGQKAPRDYEIDEAITL